MLEIKTRVSGALIVKTVLLKCVSLTAPYVKQCHEADPKLMECFISALHHLRPYLATGITEIELPSVEPFRMDELSLSLTGGPSGFKVTLADIDIYGASNFTVTKIRSDIDTYQFQITLFIPHISARAKYVSSGILILVQASGGGDYWGEYEGVRAKIYIRAKPILKNGRTYLSLQESKMDFSVKSIRMGVENVHNGNSVLQAALNLFINTNGQELLKEMKPDLKKKLLATLSNFVENLFAKIPYDAWIVG
ncbi:protein takeout-like isoform X2 [Agrilus planipennis]|uniref:Protein takeout-like isoform X2 n=1 Tax=Agrilus planipennis TaxID=224129 RepID=A0A7F5RF49_AGRPL|nr:protein takeout-like isoform X2 [Agrilus planipennis]